MFSIYIYGMLAIIVIAVFRAGYRFDQLFVSKSNSYSERPGTLYIDGDKIFVYIMKTGIITLSWPLSLPLVGVFWLGKNYNKLRRKPEGGGEFKL